jgi:hypothetical protein
MIIIIEIFDKENDSVKENRNKIIYLKILKMIIVIHYRH